MGGDAEVAKNSGQTTIDCARSQPLAHRMPRWKQVLILGVLCDAIRSRAREKPERNRLAHRRTSLGLHLLRLPLSRQTTVRSTHGHSRGHHGHSGHNPIDPRNPCAQIPLVVVREITVDDLRLVSSNRDVPAFKPFPTDTAGECEAWQRALTEDIRCNAEVQQHRNRHHVNQQGGEFASVPWRAGAVVEERHSVHRHLQCTPQHQHHVEDGHARREDDGVDHCSEKRPIALR
mmetsp:Transcript_27746/g.44448  ORF Transcript_27746/g.44448 Transcript_27746/m.44448 type:complete len:232 (-) Transcript_27746:1658-2353(-)